MTKTKPAPTRTTPAIPCSAPLCPVASTFDPCQCSCRGVNHGKNAP